MGEKVRLTGTGLANNDQQASEVGFYTNFLLIIFTEMDWGMVQV